MKEDPTLDTRGAWELRDLGEVRQGGSKDLESSVLGASSEPQNPGRWNSCTGWCCPLQETAGPELGRGNPDSTLPEDPTSLAPVARLSSGTLDPLVLTTLSFSTHNRQECRELK